MNEALTYGKIGLHLTEQFEGCSLVAYQDSKGVWTIGYGHTSSVVPGMTCTQAQAETWLSEDIAWAEAVVKNHVKIQLTQDEFDALVDFVFNAGSGNFDSSTLLKDINLGNIEAASKQFELWDKAGGKVVAGLLRRRLAEEALFSGLRTGNS
jgi:lysozyme